MLRLEIALILALGGCGCASSSTPATEAPSSTQPNAPAAVETSAPTASEADGAASPPAPAAGTDQTAAAAAPTPFEVCGQMCERMVQNCAESVLKTCRLNCKQYQKLPAGCDEEARAALECARDADDVQCAAIAPISCNAVFKRFAACTRGEKLTAKAAEPAAVQGWERFTAKTAGFSALMPRGVVEKPESGDPSFRVEDGKVTYSVRVRTAPEQKPTQKTLVKLALDLLGVNCSKNLRLHGMIEHDQRVSIRFDSRCKDGIEWRGQFVVARGKLYVLAVTGPLGFKAESEAFFTSFESS